MDTVSPTTPHTSSPVRKISKHKSGYSLDSSRDSLDTNHLDYKQEDGGEECDTPRRDCDDSGISFEAGLDELDETVIIVCSNCGLETPLADARKSYKSCHNCYTHYCRRECRREHWEQHKIKCFYSRLNSACKHAIIKVKDDEYTQYRISRIAQTGYLCKGRGFVSLYFDDISFANKFVVDGWPALKFHPTFVHFKELELCAEVDEYCHSLLDICKHYDPMIKFVLDVAVASKEKIPKHPVPKRTGELIRKCIRIRLRKINPFSNNLTPNGPETLILTSVPRSGDNLSEKKAREVCFANIQCQLRQRGVSLRHQFPDVYNKLCSYVADNSHFTPVTLYPQDATTGKTFMCLIMPDSDPESLDWVQDPEIFSKLDLSFE